MKRAFSFLLALLAAALCACSAPNAEYGGIAAACEKHAGAHDVKAKFRLNMTFEDGAYTLLFSQGNYEAELGDDVYVSVKASQNYLGRPSALEAEYKDGVYSATGETVAPSDFFGQLLFVQPFVPDEKFISSVREVSTGSGTGAVFALRDAFDLLFPLLGEDIYEIAMIKKPRRELASVSGAELTVIPGGTSGVAAMTLNFTLTLADTPPYVPGGADRQDDYMIDIKVEYTVSFE